MVLKRFSFALIQLIILPIRILPYRAIHGLGSFLGILIYYGSAKYRKRTLSNLALAQDLNLPPDQLRDIAKRSLGNLMITCLEYAKFASEKKISRVARCENPEVAAALMKQGTPVIFFCAHQSNWEVLFLEGTSRMPGVAIGRPIKNQVLYEWLTGIREKFGGHMIAPRNAVKEGLRGLKKGSFLGIVGDQGMPDSGYSCPFLGRRAWTSPLPALLAHRTGSPIIFASTRRSEGKYIIHYSEPIWPDKQAPAEQEIDRMMRRCLHLLEESIKQEPSQWLWSHNRWKQQTPHRIKRPFRQECLCIILPEHKIALANIQPHLQTFRDIYPLEFITCKVPQALAEHVVWDEVEIETYKHADELLNGDFRFKLVFDFTSSSKVRTHFHKLSAFAVVDMQKLCKANPGDHLTDILHKALLHAP